MRLALALVFVVGVGFEIATYAAPEEVEWPHRKRCTERPVGVGWGVVLYGPESAPESVQEDTCWGGFIPAADLAKHYPFRQPLKPGETFRVPAGYYFVTHVNNGALPSGEHHAPVGALLTLPEVIE